MSEQPIDINVKLCKACGICYYFCPTKAIKNDENGKVVLTNPEKCIKCGICESLCPDYVIIVRR